jgi:Right handed beta helix region
MTPRAAARGVVIGLLVGFFSSPVAAFDGTPGLRLNIRDFGAVCDGVSDDSPAINAAISRAGEHPGSMVFFPASARPCMMSRAIIMPDGITLDASPGSLVIRARADNRSAPLLLQLGSHDKIHGLSFDGGGESVSGTANAIQGYRVSGVTLDHISVAHTNGPAVVLSSDIVDSGVWHSVFFDIGNLWKRTHLASDRKPGVVFCCGSGNRGNSAEDNVFEDVGLDALQFSDQASVRVVDNRFTMENGQRRTVAAPDYPAAIFLVRVNQAQISANIIQGAQGAGIDAPGLTNSIIEGNIISGCGSTGIGLFSTKGYDGPFTSTDHVEVRSNRIISNTRWADTPHPGGITLSGSAAHVKLTGNRVTNDDVWRTQKYGVYVVPGTTIDGLTVDGSNELGGNLIAPISPPRWAAVPSR